MVVVGTDSTDLDLFVQTIALDRDLYSAKHVIQPLFAVYKSVLKWLDVHCGRGLACTDCHLYQGNMVAICVFTV